MEIISKKEAIKKGLSRYFTGKPCKNGHISERNVLRSDCLECIRERARKNYSSNKENIKKYYNENKEVRQKYLKDYYEKNKETILNRSKKRWEEKKDEIKKYKSEYKEKNSQKIKDYHKNHSQTEKRKIQKRASNNKRYALKKSTCDGSITPDSIKSMKETQINLCNICECDISNHFHIDHIKPLSKGGIHSIKNIQLLCPNCNIKKGDKFEDKI